MATVSLLSAKRNTKQSFATVHGQELAANLLAELAEQRDTRDEDADESAEAHIAAALMGEYLDLARESGNVFVERAFLAVIAARLGAVEREVRHG